MNDESPSEPRDLDEWASAVMSGYDGVAEAYDDDRDPAHEATLVESLAADLPDGARVLDAGCGGGRAVLETLAGEFETVGVDLSGEQLTLARDRAPAASLARGDLTRLPVADDAVDAVTALHSVIHVPREHHERAFAEFARVLRPGGRLLLTTGVGEWEGENDDWLDSGAAMQWSFHGRERSIELLESVGFDVTEEAVRDDELGGGEWLFVRARLRA
ncbi:ubiquinone/menaquinone biosynthesis methyltransferase UbiE [Halosimplex carlsbadense 2-9-1]|uniref:Ubiquinone/menaquinone biosynthesis methyltransferase UbiE n=1 Tax=Halosimplex carlsbadense 2-9-1 TaxID=797114 RepID=M0CHT3_9EURY|nr:class I SAM-dependent methyltransferase [Halosimplex carlsbadense]ELZ22796.1 ubiquinone/menaquinone biosynthesis methyltransferase UbiE [Halosimplex carlsbadense 2-9-1]